jgi:spermidine synthase
MIPDLVLEWVERGRAIAPGGSELVLRQRGDAFEIRVDGRELMSTRAHGSEEQLALLACHRAALMRAPRVLVGGLGLGYTLRSTLDVLPKDAHVVVAELVEPVIEWNRSILGGLANHPLNDNRVEVFHGDVAELLSACTHAYDVITLDVDNGPDDLSCIANAALYAEDGLRMVRRALREGGVLAVWSSSPSRAFEQQLLDAGFATRSVEVFARGDVGDPSHTIFLGELLESGQAG